MLSTYGNNPKNVEKQICLTCLGCVQPHQTCGHCFKRETLVLALHIFFVAHHIHSSLGIQRLWCFFWRRLLAWNSWKSKPWLAQNVKWNLNLGLYSFRKLAVNCKGLYIMVNFHFPFPRLPSAPLRSRLRSKPREPLVSRSLTAACYLLSNLSSSPLRWI